MIQNPCRRSPRLSKDNYEVLKPIKPDSVLDRRSTGRVRSTQKTADSFQETPRTLLENFIAGHDTVQTPVRNRTRVHKSPKGPPSKVQRFSPRQHVIPSSKTDVQKPTLNSSRKLSPRPSGNRSFTTSLRKKATMKNFLLNDNQGPTPRTMIQGFIGDANIETPVSGTVLRQSLEGAGNLTVPSFMLDRSTRPGSLSGQFTVEDSFVGSCSQDSGERLQRLKNRSRKRPLINKDVFAGIIDDLKNQTDQTVMDNGDDYTAEMDDRQERKKPSEATNKPTEDTDHQQTYPKDVEPEGEAADVEPHAEEQQAHGTETDSEIQDDTASDNLLSKSHSQQHQLVSPEAHEQMMEHSIHVSTNYQQGDSSHEHLHQFTENMDISEIQNPELELDEEHEMSVEIEENGHSMNNQSSQRSLQDISNAEIPTSSASKLKQLKITDILHTPGSLVQLDNLQRTALNKSLVQLTQPAVRSTPQNGQQQVRKNIAGPKRKPSTHSETSKTNQAPRLPRNLTKSIFEHFSRSRVSKQVLDHVEKIADEFWKNATCDLMAYMNHAHRKGIEQSDVELLMKRQGFITDKQSLNTLIGNYLPLEYRQELIPMARADNQLDSKI